MNYFYNGKKPSVASNIASGCFLLVAIVVIILLFSVMDDFDDLEGHYLELFFILIMAGSAIYGFFKKKGKLHTHKIEITKDNLHVNDFKIPINNITLDIYNIDVSFNRYHLWDSKGILSIFSIFEDDLYNDFINSFKENIKLHKEISSSQNGASVSVKSDDNHLSYDLESGEFKIIKDSETVFNKTPQFFIYDPKYKKGKGLNKKL
jgi:hypothetical protein